MSNTKDSLGDRMKEKYENRAKTYLVRRIPVVLRLDGKAFRNFTKGFERPYDKIFHNSMNETMKHLCENIQGCKLGYTQSDEITLLLTDFDKLTTDAWFDYAVQKICSVAASMATMKFNQVFQSEIVKEENDWKCSLVPQSMEIQMAHNRYIEALKKSAQNGAMFDARCFNIPVEEVTNCFIWRQQDATRNAIQMLGQCKFSHKELQNKSCNDIQDMLIKQKNINFNDMPTIFKRGCCCIKNYSICEPWGNRKANPNIPEGIWFIDTEIPIFTQDRGYIENTFINRGD